MFQIPMLTIFGISLLNISKIKKNHFLLGSVIIGFGFGKLSVFALSAGISLYFYQKINLMTDMNKLEGNENTIDFSTKR